MAFEWMMKLNDMASSPADKITKKLFELEQQLRSLDIVAKKHQLANPKLKNELRRATLELQIQRNELAMTRRELEHHISKMDVFRRGVSALRDQTHTTREAFRDWLLILTPLAMGLRFVYDRAKELGRELIEPIRAVEEASIGLKTMFGENLADSLIKQLQGLGPRIGRPIAGLLKEANALALAGAPQEYIYPTILAMKDLEATGKDVSKLQYVFQSMFSRPIVDIHELRKGLSGVIEEAKVWQAFADINHMSVGNVNWLVSHNLVPNRAGQDALLLAIQRQNGGKIGDTAIGELAFGRGELNVSAKIDRITASVEKLKMGLMETGGFKVFNDFLDNVITILNNGKLDTALKSIADTLGETLKPLTGEGGKEKMENFFDSLREKILGVIPAASTLGKALNFFSDVYNGLSIGISAIRHPLTSTMPASASDKEAMLDAALGDPSLSTFLAKAYQRSSSAQDAETWMGGGPAFRDFSKGYVGAETDTGLPSLSKSGRVVPGINITIPVQIIAGEYDGASGGQMLSEATKRSALMKLAETLDQINAQHP